MSNNVYQVLNISGNGPEELTALSGRPAGAVGQGSSASGAWPGDKWLIQSRGEDGLSVCYQLCLIYPREQDFPPALPWPVQEVCPTCQGQGLVYRWRRDKSSYEASLCEDCRAEGPPPDNSEIDITVNDGQGGRRVIRKRPAGRYNARLGLKGDLILNITWAEELPAPDERRRL
ncbi:MAG: hypothetical protein LBP33_07640 [Candidatus Adiutrix sp.]|jgi:hypothetical protein|nr:hypothetical protein [Candidatus Adiutrix sp.]